MPSPSSNRVTMLRQKFSAGEITSAGHNSERRSGSTCLVAVQQVLLQKNIWKG
ncbi:unnamed protein product [Brassica oleracea var. botrytis]